MRSSVDLPQPDGPTKHDELAVGDVQVDPVDRLHVAVLLHELFELDLSHQYFRLLRHMPGRGAAARRNITIRTGTTAERGSRRTVPSSTPRKVL